MQFFADWRTVALLVGVGLGIILAVIFYVKYKMLETEHAKLTRDNNCLCTKIEKMNLEINRYRAKLRIGGISDEELVNSIVSSLDNIYKDWDGTGTGGDVNS